MNGILAIWTDVAPAAEADFNDWYDREHLPERVGVPGFRTAQRYRALSEGPAYLAWYETASVDVLASPGYLERLDRPTAWTRRVMPAFRDTVRSVFAVRAAAGRGLGGVAATLRLGAGEPPPAWLDGTTLRRIAERPGILGAQWWEAVAHAASATTAETRLRGPDRVAAAAVIVQAIDPEPLADAIAALGGVAGAGRFQTWRLLHALRAPGGDEAAQGSWTA